MTHTSRWHYSARMTDLVMALGGEFRITIPLVAQLLMRCRICFRLAMAHEKQDLRNQTIARTYEKEGSATVAYASITLRRPSRRRQA